MTIKRGDRRRAPRLQGQAHRGLTGRIDQQGAIRQGDLAELAQVAGQALGGFGGVEGRQVVESFRLAGQDLMGGSAEGVVVEAGR